MSDSFLIAFPLVQPEISIPTLYKMKRKQLVALAKKFDLNTQAKNNDLIQSISAFGTMTG